MLSVLIPPSTHTRLNLFDHACQKPVRNQSELTIYRCLFNISLIHLVIQSVGHQATFVSFSRTSSAHQQECQLDKLRPGSDSQHTQWSKTAHLETKLFASVCWKKNYPSVCDVDASIWSCGRIIRFGPKNFKLNPSHMHVSSAPQKRSAVLSCYF